MCWSGRRSWPHRHRGDKPVTHRGWRRSSACPAKEIPPAYPDILPSARQVTVPALYVGTTDDPYTDGKVQQQQFHQAIHGTPNELLQLEGSAHGTELLDQRLLDGGTVTDRITTFIRGQL